MEGAKLKTWEKLPRPADSLSWVREKCIFSTIGAQVVVDITVLGASTIHPSTPLTQQFAQQLNCQFQ